MGSLIYVIRTSLVGIMVVYALVINVKVLALCEKLFPTWTVDRPNVND